MRVLIIGTVMAVMLPILPVSAHTRQELSAWQTDWEVQVALELTPELIDEYQDMARRHPCRITECRHRAHTSLRIVGRPGVAVDGLPVNVERWRSLVAQYWLAADVDFALCLIALESGGDPNADNPRSSASGLMQHLASYWDERSAKAGWTGASIWDPEANIAVGAWLYYTGGAGHWTPHAKCGR